MLQTQTTRANLVVEYNQMIEQIKTAAQDSSFNGVNLLNGDALKLAFNETGKSTLNRRRSRRSRRRKNPAVFPLLRENERPVT